MRRHQRDAVPRYGDAPTVRGGRGVKGEAQAQGLSQRDSTGWLELCVHLAELRRSILQRLAHALGVQQ